MRLTGLEIGELLTADGVNQHIRGFAQQLLLCTREAQAKTFNGADIHNVRLLINVHDKRLYANGHYNCLERFAKGEVPTIRAPAGWHRTSMPGGQIDCVSPAANVCTRIRKRCAHWSVASVSDVER